MERNLPPGFLDRTEAREVDLPVGCVLLQKGPHERDGPLGIAAHDLVDSRPLFGVVLVDAFEPVFERPVADVLVVRGTHLLLGHQERPVLLRQERRRIRKVQDVARLEPAVFLAAGLGVESLCRRV